MRQEFRAFIIFSILLIIHLIFAYIISQSFNWFSISIQFAIFWLPFGLAVFLYFFVAKRIGLKDNLDKVRDSIIQPFRVRASTRTIQYAVDAARIFAGLSILFTFVDSLSYALLLSPEPQAIFALYTGYIVLSFLFAIGFFTPITGFVFLIFLYTSPEPFPFGTLLLRIVLIGSILLGAGRSLSVDFLLLKLKGVRQLLTFLYSLIPPISPAYYAQVRLLLLILFWGVNFTVARVHLNDAYWVQGDALIMILTIPFLTDWYQSLVALRDFMPAFSYVIGVVAIVFQMVYELATVPLCFFKWGRVFVALQSLAFTFVIAFIMSVAGQVANIQFSIWIIIFLPEVLDWFRNWTK